MTSTSAHADTTYVYSDTTNFTGQAYVLGGATLSGGTVSTRMAADDITAAAGMAGTPINVVSFSVANFNGSSETFNALFSVFADDSGAPGTLLASLPFNAITIGGGSVQIFSYAGGSALFVTPSTNFWVGLTLTDGGTNEITAGALNNMGLGIFNPPTVGSSQDTFFLSTDSYTGGSNPAGSNSDFSGTPVANFGFALGNSLPAVTPEPSSLSLLGIGMASLGVFARKLRRSA